MHNRFKKNNTILCVDDDEDILDAYKRGLEGENKEYIETESIFAERRRRGKTIEKNNNKPCTGPHQETDAKFRILTASSGEMAIEIVKNELKEDRKIAAGFFDMRMPGGIDGLETIKKIRKIDPLILCAVVTAYTDRSISQIGEIFDQKDEWIYFSKPFAIQELEQAAINLVSSWNRRRREEHHLSVIEKSMNGLHHILEAILKLSEIPPEAIQSLLDGILEQVIGLAGTTSGFLFITGEDDKIILKSGVGKYNSLSIEDINEMVNREPFVKESIEKKRITKSESTYSIPLAGAKKVFGIIYLENRSDSIPYIDLLEIFRLQISRLIENLKLYNDLEMANYLLRKENQKMSEILKGLSPNE